MDRGKTVIEAKAAFLRSQIRLLSAILQPSRQWRDFADNPEEDDIPEKVVQEVMVKVNEKLKQHNRAVYSAPSQRHVAEQIDALYWQIVSADDAQVDSDTVVVRKDADLMQTETIESLPQSYSDLYLLRSSSSNSSTTTVDSTRYTTLHTRLLALAADRDAQTQKLTRYKQLQTLLEPFTNAQENIQPNLVTKDGELGKELEKMRVLLARVQRGIVELKEKGKDDQRGNGEEGTSGVSNERKLADVMDLT